MGNEFRIGFFGNPEKGAEGSHQNTGNFVHGHAARKLFRTLTEITVDESDENIERLRSSITHVGFVAATTISVGRDSRYGEKHLQLSRFIKKLGLPVVTFGLGSQAGLGATIEGVYVDPRTQQFIRTLSEHSETMAVRGQYTADLIQSMGIHNVEVVGCQSCFMSMDPGFLCPEIDQEFSTSRAVINCTQIAPEFILIQEAMQRNLPFIGQTSFFEYAIKDIPLGVSLDALPVHVAKLRESGIDRLIKSGKLAFNDYHLWIKNSFHQFYNIPSWVEFLKGRFQMSIGTRFHGNMIAMQSGIPSLWIVHDMRTREFCDLLGLPNAPLAEVQKGSRIIELIDTYYDTSKFNRVYLDNYMRFRTYLERQGVQHILPLPN